MIQEEEGELNDQSNWVTSNIEEEEVQIIEEEIPNTFGVKEYIKKDQQATQLIVDADTSTQTISLLSMSLFVHQTDEFLMCE